MKTEISHFFIHRDIRLKQKFGKNLTLFLAFFIIHVVTLVFALSPNGGWFFAILWFLSIAGMLRALYRSSGSLHRHSAPSSAKICLIAIIAVSAFLRIYKITVMPPGLWVDEIYTASNAMELNLNGVWKNPFSMTPLVGPGWVQTSNLYLYLVRFLLSITGVNYIGVKMLSILPGVAAVILLYYFVKQQWGIKAALGAAFFLAVSSWQISLSRWGWDEVFLTALQIPVFIYLWKGIRKQRDFDFGLAGAFLGLCLYTYASSRALVLFAFFFLFLESIIHPDFFRKNKRKIGFFAFFFLITILPLGIYCIKNPSVIGSRMNQVSILKDLKAHSSFLPLFHNIRKHVLMFFFMGDPNVRHHLPYRPLLDMVSRIFMFIGLISCVLGIRKRKNRFVLLWLGFALLGGILSLAKEAPQSYRTGISAIPAFALCGVGLLSFIRAARKWRILHGKPGRYILRGFIYLLLAASLFLNYRRYFIQYPREEELREKFWGTEHTIRARIVKDYMKQGRQVFLDSSYEHAWFFPYRIAMKIVCGEVPPWYSPIDGGGEEIKENAVILIPPFRKATYEKLRPGLSFSPIQGFEGKTSFYAAEIPEEQTKKYSGITEQDAALFELEYYRDNKLLMRETRNSMRFSQAPGGTNRILVHAVLNLPSDYHSVFRVESDAPATLSFDGMDVLSETDEEKIIPLAGGRRHLTLEIRPNNFPVRTKVIWRPDFEHNEPIPPAFFFPLP